MNYATRPTYLGGSGEDFGYDIAVDSAGNAYVSGTTFSNEVTFPVTVGPDLTFNGDRDAFVAKINPPLAQRYSVTDLGDLPGGADSSGATAINDNGEVVGGSSGDIDSDYSGYETTAKPFLWTPSAGMQKISIFPLPTAIGGFARGINNDGQVVGQLQYSPDGTIIRPFLWTAAGGMQVVGDRSGPGSATAINGAGQVVGTLGISAFRWTAAGGFDSLTGITAVYSGAQAINSKGEVAGHILLGKYQPVFWDAAGNIHYMDGVPSTLGGSLAWGINDKGEVVGQVGVGNEPASPLFSEPGNHGFFWSPTSGVQNIGELPTLGPHHTIPYSINNSGQVVGTSTNSDRAFLWTAEAGIWDLNDLLDASGSGWTLSVAFDINDHGQIVGSGIHNGVGHAFLLTPIDTPPPPQPILSVTPTSLDFDTIAVGSSKDLDLTVQNTGGGTLEGSCSTDAPFSLPDGCSFSVLAGQSQEVKVRFSPTAAGIFMGEVNFTSNGGTASPTIIGTAEPALVPAVALSSTRLTFGDQTIGSTSAPQTVTLTSSGTADLVLGILSLEGANPSDYVLSNNTCASATLPPGADCTFDVAFSPTAAGARTAAVNIVSNAANSPHPATLTGMGIIDICQANIDDSDFERAFPKIKKYLKRVFKVANVSQDVLEAITWGEFEGTPLWKILIFAITVEEFLKQADRPIDKINHELILVELATFTSEWGFTFLLSRLGSSFAGVASWASLGVLPITSSLERFVRDVKKIALTNQVKLHHLARNAGCSQESLLNRQDNCPDATLSFTDDGWLNAVTTTSQGTLRCGFLQACYPRPLTPSEVYGYAETLWLRPLSEVKADYLEDKVQIGNILRERIVQCSK